MIKNTEIVLQSIKYNLRKINFNQTSTTFTVDNKRAYRGDDLAGGELAEVESDIPAGVGGHGHQHQGAHQQHAHLHAKYRVKLPVFDGLPEGTVSRDGSVSF